MTEKKLFTTRGIGNQLQDSIEIGRHPTRREILKLLKEYDSLSAVEIIDKMGVNKDDRYKLYHHLQLLYDKKLIEKFQKEDNNKTYYFKLFYTSKPIVMAFSYDKTEIKENKETIYTILDLIGSLEKHKVQSRSKIKSIEININYEYEEEDIKWI